MKKSSLALAATFGLALSLQAQDRDILSWQGSEPNNRFGIAIANLGDVDKDGTTDFAIGEDGANQGAGLVHIVSGADGRTIRRHSGPKSSFLGWSIAALGDMNRDGHADYGASAPSATIGTKTRAGSVFVWSGKDGKQLYRFDGDAINWGFGRVIAGLGDVTRDGIPDLAVSATGVDNGAIKRAGLVRIFSGRDGKVVRELRGSSTNEAYGSTLVDIGSVNGDPFSDVLIGSQWANAADGIADIVSGLWLFTGSGTKYLYRFKGPSGKADSFAFPGGTRGLGDINGDKIGDFAIAAGQWQNKAEGYVNLYSGKDGKIIRKITGKTKNEGFGSQSATIGDLDGDKVPEIAIAAPSARTQNGDATGRIDVYSGKWIATGTGNDVLFSINGDGPYRSIYARGLLAAGDVNKDGTPDMLVAELWNPGRVSVVSGKVLALGASRHHVSAFRFSKTDFQVTFGDRKNTAMWNQPYWIFGTASGTSPGFKFFGLTVPLNIDSYTSLVAASINGANFVRFGGKMGWPGVASAELWLPPLGTSALGLKLHHAALGLDTKTGKWVVSNPAILRFTR